MQDAMSKVKAAARSRNCKHSARTAVKARGARTTKKRIIPQSRAKVSDQPLQCWAHIRTGKRCTAKVSSREGEPIPIVSVARQRVSNTCLSFSRVPPTSPAFHAAVLRSSPPVGRWRAESRKTPSLREGIGGAI